MGAGRLIAVLMTALLAGCASATPEADQGDAPASARRAPEGSYTVGVRTLTLDPRSARPLPVTIWYPVSTDGVAAGRFPVVIYSHGLHSRPDLHAGLTTRWAAAGFVVAAPAYPHTGRVPPSSAGPTSATSPPTPGGWSGTWAVSTGVATTRSPGTWT